MIDVHATDQDAIAAEVEAAAEGRAIGDGCARAIASQFAQFERGQAFSTTGAILPPDDPEGGHRAARELFGDLFEREYPTLDPADKAAANALLTYLVAAGQRGPQPGWHAVWVR